MVLYDSEPSAQIISPSSSGVYYADELIQFEGLASDDEDEPALLQINWESSIQGTLDVDTTPDADGSSSDLATSKQENTVSASLLRTQVERLHLKILSLW